MPKKNADAPSINDPDPELALGQVMRDRITGFEGTATAMVENFNGNVRFALSPKYDPARGMGEAFEFDAISLEYVHDGLSDDVVEANNNGIELGNKVRDLITGFKGIVTDRITSVNGCVHYCVFPKIGKKGWKTFQPKESTISSVILVVIGDGLAGIAEEAVATGGPATKFIRP